MRKKTVSKVDVGIIDASNIIGVIDRAREDERVLLDAIGGLDKEQYKIKVFDWGKVGTNYVTEFLVVSNKLADNTFMGIKEVCDKFRQMATLPSI